MARRLATLLCLLAALGAPVALAAGLRPPELRNVDFPGYDDETGRLEWRVKGKTGRPLGEDTYLVGEPVVYLYGSTVNVGIRADEGTINLRDSNAQLRGNVVMAFTDPERTRLYTDHISWSPDEERATTDAPVVILREGTKITGIGLETSVAAEIRGRILREAGLTITGESSVAFAPKGGKVVVTSHGALVMEPDRHEATFENDVRVTGSNGFLTSDRLVILFDPQDGRSISKVIATGNCVLETITRAMPAEQ